MRRLIMISVLFLAGCDVDLFDPLGNASYDYAALLPDRYGSSGARKWPVLIFLHGAGGLPQGNPISNHALGADSFPVILITPSSNEGWETDRLKNLLEEVQDRYRTDPDRIYVTGFSMGAHGAFAWAAEEPNRIAAAIMIAGAGPSGQGCRIKAVPSWFIHNRLDPVVPTSETERTVAELQACGAQPIVTINEDPPFRGAHDAWTTGYQNPALWKWLFSQSLLQRLTAN